MSRSNNDYKNSAGGNGGDLWKSASITVKNNNQNFGFHLICTGCCLGSLLSSMILESHAVVLEEKTVRLVWRPDISAIKIGHGDSTDWHVQKVYSVCLFLQKRKEKEGLEQLIQISFFLARYTSSTVKCRTIAILHGLLSSGFVPTKSLSQRKK